MPGLSREQAIDLLERLLWEIDWVRARGHGSPDFLRWQDETQAAIVRIFGEGARSCREFSSIRYTPATHSAFLSDNAQEWAFQRGLQRARSILESLIRDLESREE